MFTIRKAFKVEMAHQLVSAHSKCCTDCIHGHSYTIEVFLRCDKLDENGMVLDFGKLKELIGKYIQSWDHALVLTRGTVQQYPQLKEQNKKIVEVPWNPTAEAMAYAMCLDISFCLQDEGKCRDLRVWKVRVRETDTGWAEYEEG